LAGFLSGCTEAFVVNPFETVKVKLQSERVAFAAVSSIEFCSAVSVIRVVNAMSVSVGVVSVISDAHSCIFQASSIFNSIS